MVAKKFFQYVLFSVVFFLLSTDITYSSWFEFIEPEKQECKIYLEPSQLKKSSPIRFVLKTKGNGTLVFSAEGLEEFTELHLVIGDSRRLFTPIIRANIVGIVESPEWQNLFDNFPIYLTGKTHSDNYTSAVYQRIDPMKFLKSMEKKCGVFIEDIPPTKQNLLTVEQNLNLNDLEKKFIIWALKRHFRSWEYSIPVHPELNTEIREKLKLFSREHGLPPSSFVSSAVISKLKEKNGFSILPQYENAHMFCNGVAAVKLNGLWGLVDTENHWVLSPSYKNVGWCSDGYLPVMRDKFWGLINHKGVLVLPIIYQEILKCSQQRCGVKINNKWGYFDPNGGKMIIQPQYDAAKPFRDGYAAVKKGRRWLIINRYGSTVLNRFLAKKLFSPSEGLSLFENSKKKLGFINLSGKIVIPAKFNSARYFSEGLAPVSNGRRWGFVDYSGKLKIPFKFRIARSFDQGLALAKNASGKWGYIDKSGNWVIYPNFNRTYPFYNGIANVRVDNPSGKNPYRGFINKDGSFYYEPIFENVYKFREGLAPVQLFGHWGFLSKRLIDK